VKKGPKEVTPKKGARSFFSWAVTLTVTSVNDYQFDTPMRANSEYIGINRTEPFGVIVM